MASFDNDEELPVEVRELLRERITSIEALEVAVALFESEGRARSVAELAAQLRLPESSVKGAMGELEIAGIAALEGAESARFQTSSPELERSLRSLVASYEKLRVEMLVFISQNAIRRVRTNALTTFAEAFRLQGRKK
jgi:hypothetical protein